jgi:D-galacturonate reductase
MKYSPGAGGHFDGQRGYGYLSIESFVDCCIKLNRGELTLQGG